MIRVLRSATLLLFVASAVMKTLDFDATRVLVSRAWDMHLPLAGLLVVALILAELALAGVIALLPAGRRSAYIAGATLTIAFLAAALSLWWTGAQNCGCFGTLLPMSPAATAAKNIVLFAAFACLIRFDKRTSTGSDRYRR